MEITKGVYYNMTPMTSFQDRDFDLIHQRKRGIINSRWIHLILVGLISWVIPRLGGYQEICLQCCYQEALSNGGSFNSNPSLKIKGDEIIKSAI